MFRRKDEESMDADGSNQGSLLGSESVKIINPSDANYSGAASSAASHMQASQPSASSATNPYASQRSATPPSPFRSAAPEAPARSARAPEPPRAPEPKQQQQQQQAYAPPPPPPAIERSVAMKDSRRILTVGNEILLKGEIANCDRLIIEGKADAVLNDVGTMELAESGTFKGIATVDNAEISGLFDGELIVKGRLVVHATGRVRGKVSYGEIEIQRGGEITGEIKTLAGNSGGGRKTPITKEKEAA